MSFCPSKDIHSVYLDNELPDIYKAEYEAHLENCPKCRAELEKIRKLQNLLRTDSASITPDSHYLDESYERLMVKMNYSKNVGKNKSVSGFNFNIKYVATAAAAAAVFAFIIPLRLSKGEAGGGVVASASNSANNVTSVAVPSVNASRFTNNVSLNSGNGVVISGNINKSPFAQRVSENHAQNVSNSSRVVPEVFRPSFENNETISIKITLPGMNSTPVVAEIELPADVVSGRY